MKTTILTVLLLCAINLFAEEFPLGEQSKSAAYFTDMRMQYSERPDFQGGGWVADEEREALLEKYDEDAPKDFIARSEQWLRKCPVDAKIHLMRASLLLKVGDVSAHFYHRMVYYGLMTSIVTSGDGKTTKTAYRVISADEEYTLLNHIGAKVKSQALVDGPCDAMKVELNGKDTTIYFNVSIPLVAAQKATEKNKKK